MENLKELKEEMQNIAGEWNGDDSGRLEDRAIVAQNIVDKINMIELMLKKIEELQAELNEL